MPRPGSRNAAVAAVFAVTLLLSGASAASADTTTSTYGVKADATALDLKVFGQGITIGLTHTEASSLPHARAGGIGLVLPNSTLVSAEAFQSTTNGESLGTADPPACAASTPADFPLVQLSLACADGELSIVDGLANASANASVTNLVVNGSSVLSQLPLKTITDQVQTVLDNLKPVFEGIKQDVGLDAESLLTQLIGDITAGQDLVRITLGPASASSGATTDTVSTASSALGGVIEVLPRDTLPVPLPPVVKIEVGAGSTTIDFDRATGQPTVHIDPALIRVTIADDVATALGLPAGANVVEVAPGQTHCLGLPAPLDSCISVASGTSSTEDNVTRASTSGVSLHLLTGLSDGVRLALVNTAVEGFVTNDVAREAPPDSSPPLARTGGTVDTMLGGTLFAVAVGGVVLARRSRRRLELI